METEGGFGMLSQLFAFTAFHVCEKNKAVFIEAFKKEDARRRHAISPYRRHRHGVGIVDFAFLGSRKPFP
jgi:hypothetical protein